MGQTAWSSAKKAWCCQHRNIGCPIHEVSTPALPVRNVVEHHGCDLSQHTFEMWSPSRKHWCCAKQGKGCAEYDCGHDLFTWRKSWSHGKKTWCCARKHYGCEPGTISQKFNEGAMSLPFAL